MHLPINSPPPAPGTTEKKKFHGDKARGWTLLNESFCVASGDSVSGSWLFESYDAVRRVYSQGVTDKIQQKWKEQQEGCSSVRAACCVHTPAACFSYLNTSSMFKPTGFSPIPDIFPKEKQGSTRCAR